MTDITNTNLSAALIDQNVAGTFRNKNYAFVTVVDNVGWRLAVAVANERGYNPTGKTFVDKDEAEKFADGLNEHIGLSDDEAVAIIVSTMGGRKYDGRRFRCGGARK